MKKEKLVCALITAILIPMLVFGFTQKTAANEVVINHGKSIFDIENKPAAMANAQPFEYNERVVEQLRSFEINKDGDLSACEQTVSRTLINLPMAHTKELRAVNLTGKKMDRRGYGGYGTITLQCTGMISTELVGVLVHEMGHIADTDYLNGRELSASAFIDFDRYVPVDDKSVDFYSISWTNSQMQKPGAARMDFVTGYAMTDPFEDFAETYTMYVLHGQQFARMAEKNDALMAKYNFMRDVVFAGQEFYNDSKRLNTSARVYDSTRMKFSLDKFLGME